MARIRNTRRRTASDSVQAQMAREQAATQVVDPPVGTVWPTEEHRLLWGQLSTARLASDWSVADLVQLVDLVNVECRLRSLETQLGMEGDVIINRHGEPAPNPLTHLVNQRRSQKLSLLRNLGISARDKGSEQSIRRAAPSVEEQQAAANRQKGASLLAVVK